MVLGSKKDLGVDAQYDLFAVTASSGGQCGVKGRKTGFLHYPHLGLPGTLRILEENEQNRK